MITRYSKRVAPARFQAAVLKDIPRFANGMKLRARRYQKGATVLVSSCYVCGSRKHQPLLAVYGFTYVRCARCSHVFSTRRATQKDLNRFYDGSADYAKTYTSKEQIAYRIKHIAGPKVEFAMRFAPKVRQGLWLDVGSAIGDVLKCVEGYKGWQAIGVELSRESVRIGQQLLKVDLRQILFKDFLNRNRDLSADVVSFFGYLELVTEPVKELRLARRHMRRGGLLVIGENNAASLSTLLQKSFPRYSTRHLLPPTVIQLFTKRSLTVAVEKAGFEPIAYWNFGLDFYEFLKYFALLVPQAGKAPAYEFLMNNLNEFQKVIDRKEMGDYFVMIAKAV